MREIIKRERVLRATASGSQSRGEHAPGLAKAAGSLGQAEQPRAARLIRVEGRARAIEVTCRCGCKSIVEIEYDEDVPSKEESL